VFDCEVLITEIGRKVEKYERLFPKGTSVTKIETVWKLT
jgi:hypothetical protein